MPGRSTTEDFIKKASEVHTNKYCYSSVEYVNTTTKIKILCLVHGEFLQTPKNHLKGYGCVDCAGNKKLSTESFISKATTIHGDRYSYSHCKYINSHTKVKIICSTHGEFEQIPNDHTSKQSGCSGCGNLGYSKKYRADGFCEETNTIYEFYGDKWHGNPVMFLKDANCHPYDNRTAHSLYEDTLKREQIIKLLGYNIITIWENEYEEVGK